VLVRADDRPEVVIAGAGVAGLALGILLAQDGLRPVCVDPDLPPRSRVGESLDWSAPALLAELGIQANDIVAAGMGTYKREVRALTPSGELMVGRPWSWLHRWPLKFESATLHVDRTRFDGLLYQEAEAAGVAFIEDRVVGLDLEGDRIVGCRTRSGRCLRSDWFVDATGRRHLIGRALGIPRDEWGIPRLSLWSEMVAPATFEGTMLHLDGGCEVLTWAWEIPIAADRQSVGVVIPLTRFRALRGAGATLEEIMIQQLGRFPRFRALRATELGPVRARRYRPFVSSRMTGSNWLMVGEAAAFVDPLSANGVTAAMRHASEAANVIVNHETSPTRTPRRLDEFERRARDIADVYNLGIEALMYESSIRLTLGMRWASRAYVPLGYFTNSLYSRLSPTTRPRMAALAVILRGFHFWARTWPIVARALAVNR